MKDEAIILDLDNTIFETNSMDKKVFDPFFNHFRNTLKPKFDDQIIGNIINDLWHMTWEAVLNKYGIPQTSIMSSIKFLESLELNLNISTYPDYTFIRALTCPKFLVTTSVTSLQESKIRALGIENDFTKVYINDTFRESKNKLDVFRELVLEFNLSPERTYVVGDNADSEIRAGNSLNMVTVQILRDNVTKGNNARHYIKSFGELEAIMKSKHQKNER